MARGDWLAFGGLFGPRTVEVVPPGELFPATEQLDAQMRGAAWAAGAPTSPIAATAAIAARAVRSMSEPPCEVGRVAGRWFLGRLARHAVSG